MLVVQGNDFFFSDGLDIFTHDFVETYSASKLVSETRDTSLKGCSFFGRLDAVRDLNWQLPYVCILIRGPFTRTLPVLPRFSLSLLFPLRTPATQVN